jgi:3-hydroxybutyryl-CoA dehydrogenase
MTPDRTPGPVGVVGAGTMGAGVAQVALEAGHEVSIHDADHATLERARERIRDGLARRAVRLGLDADTIDAWADGRLERLRPVGSLQAVAETAGVVIEAVVEDLEVKRAIFASLDAAAPPSTILGTNTSALSVGEIAAATTRTGRVVGIHFFNPAPVMALVEVVAAPGTDPAVADRAAALVTAWGKTPVRCTDSPGFIVNRVNRPYTLEALRMVEAGEAPVEAIDAALRGAGFPMGPFELMDLIGIDVNLAAARGVWEGLGRPDRLRPSDVAARLVSAGRLGRKSGSGFYAYEDARVTSVEPDFAGEPGLAAAAIVRRILGVIDAEAVRARDEGVATEADIDLALRLGAGHPVGPFERMTGR